ncbi:MAG: xanthine dehydrogenase family protein subunit M [Acidobacteriia bacterium]|nr:xanthine dehydrogenase family protein subunit M [Terriglobia bacterium]
MYPRSFHYHRASSLPEAATMLAQLGEEAKLLAGGQSLIPLMKLRFANPSHLVDLNFVPGTTYIKEENGALRFGALTRHSEIEKSAIAARVPILHDCAAGIADVQIRNRGTIGGSLAEADPSGDWATVLLTQNTELHCLGPKGERTIPLPDFITDAYTTALDHDELVREVVVKVPAKGSGGAYLAFKRSAPVYPTASAAVQLTMEKEVCQDAAIFLGCVGLMPVRAPEAEAALRGRNIDGKVLGAAMEATRAAADPQPDMRGSAEYKRSLVAALVKRAIGVAVQRARGQQVEVSHIYA